MGELSDRLVAELIDAVRQLLRKESGERLRDVYLIGDIEKDTARTCHVKQRRQQRVPGVAKAWPFIGLLLAIPAEIRINRAIRGSRPGAERTVSAISPYW